LHETEAILHCGCNPPLLGERKAAEAEGVALNQLINLTVAERCRPAYRGLIFASALAAPIAEKSWKNSERKSSVGGDEILANARFNARRKGERAKLPRKSGKSAG
jgi:hypothetical protein